MTPAEALQILTNVADAHAMNGPDRRAVNKAIETLAALLPTESK